MECKVVRQWTHRMNDSIDENLEKYENLTNAITWIFCLFTLDVKKLDLDIGVIS